MNAPAPRSIFRTAAVVAAVSALAAAGSAALLVNIMERKDEARQPFVQVVEITEETQDPAVWGANFPHQYDSYKRTVDQERTRFGGSEALPRTPTEADPRGVLTQSRIEEDTRLKTMWAGYAFSVDFREERGHAWMLLDQIHTGRQEAAPQPGTCLHCHASMVIPWRKVGDGDLMAGFAKLNPLPYKEAVTHVTHPIACIDCHEPQTMKLRVTRPGFIEGIAAYKASQGIENYDVNAMASRQDMRTFVCGQCHVEYYFRPGDKRLVYPWAKGLQVEDMLEYYDEIDFADWTHAKTGARVLKAQHPEFELYNQGMHARAGVACADCHMPYKRVGAMKVSDHHVRSPLLDPAAACQTCHRVGEDEILARAELMQEKVHGLRGEALDALVDLIADIESARAAGRGDAELAEARRLQRHAQFMVDFVESENSVGFHAPEEALRLLGRSIDHARRGQLALRAALP